MLSKPRLFSGLWLPGLLVAITVLSACEGSKPKELDTNVTHTSTSTGNPPIQLPGSASYTAFVTVTEERLGVRIYPGAKPRDGGSWQMTDKLAEGARSLLIATLHSNDAISKVTEFYTRELGIAPAQLLRVPTRNGPKISLTVEHGARGATNVMLQRADDESGTLIKITRMNGPHISHQDHQTNH